MEVILVASVSKFIERMRYWCVQANMGYSQYDRWHFDPAAGNCDCSSLVIYCLREAGFDTGSANTTRDLSANLTARGWARVSNDGNPHPGDILLNDANHVAVYIGGGLIAQASVSETGGIGGAPGDQTGGETNVSNYYNFPWNCYLRWTGNNDSQGEDDDMQAIVQINDEPALSYFDGTRLHGLSHPDQVTALQMVFNAAGKPLPAMKIGTNQAPWGTRLREALR